MSHLVDLNFNSSFIWPYIHLLLICSSWILHISYLLLAHARRVHVLVGLVWVVVRCIWISLFWAMSVPGAVAWMRGVGIQWTFLSLFYRLMLLTLRGLCASKTKNIAIFYMLKLMYSILDTLSPNFTVVRTFDRVSQACKDARAAWQYTLCPRGMAVYTM